MVRNPSKKDKALNVSALGDKANPTSIGMDMVMTIRISCLRLTRSPKGAKKRNPAALLRFVRTRASVSLSAENQITDTLCRSLTLPVLVSELQKCLSLKLRNPGRALREVAESSIERLQSGKTFEVSAALTQASVC